MKSMAVIELDNFDSGRGKPTTKSDLLKLYNIQQPALLYIEEKQKSLKTKIIDQKLIPIRGSVLLAEGCLGNDKEVSHLLSFEPIWKKLLGLLFK